MSDSGFRSSHSSSSFTKLARGAIRSIRFPHRLSRRSSTSPARGETSTIPFEESRPSPSRRFSPASGAASVTKLKSRSSRRRFVSPANGATSVTRLLRRTSTSSRRSPVSGVRSETRFSPRSRRTRFSHRSRPSRRTIPRSTAVSSVNRRRSKRPTAVASTPSASPIAAANRESVNSTGGTRPHDATSTAAIPTPSAQKILIVSPRKCSTDAAAALTEKEGGERLSFVTLPPESRRRRSRLTAHRVPYGNPRIRPRASVGW